MPNRALIVSAIQGERIRPSFSWGTFPACTTSCPPALLFLQATSGALFRLQATRAGIPSVTLVAHHFQQALACCRDSSPPNPPWLCPAASDGGRLQHRTSGRGLEKAHHRRSAAWPLRRPLAGTAGCTIISVTSAQARAGAQPEVHSRLHENLLKSTRSALRLSNETSRAHLHRLFSPVPSFATHPHGHSPPPARYLSLPNPWRRNRRGPL